MTLRFGTVPYLNIEPFVMALREVVPCKVVRRHPSQLLELARSSELDACMLSAVDILEARLEPLCGASISSAGPVASVLLLSHAAPPTWTRVALDGNSRTSNRLAQLLAQGLYAATPRCASSADPRRALRAGECDAAVLIGDRALRTRRSRHVLDLGELWTDWTGLPFVYAAWTRGLRRAVSASALEVILEEAARQSHRFVDTCARRFSAAWNLSPDRLREYLRENISYRFGRAEREGLCEFDERLRSVSCTDRELVHVGREIDQPGGRC